MATLIPFILPSDAGLVQRSHLPEQTGISQMMESKVKESLKLIKSFSAPGRFTAGGIQRHIWGKI